MTEFPAKNLAHAGTQKTYANFDEMVAAAQLRDPVDALHDAEELNRILQKPNGRILLLQREWDMGSSFWIREAARPLASLRPEEGREVAAKLVEALTKRMNTFFEAHG
jgi:uncharacterized protein YigA (DUF484 family)